MRKIVLIGILAFVAFAIMLAPAGLVSRALREIPGAGLISTSGTLWHGRGELMVGGHDIGNLSWQIRPGAVIRGKLAYDLVLGSAEDQLSGHAELGLRRTFSVIASGIVSANLVNKFLAPYDMMISGDLRLGDAGMMVTDGVPDGASGTVTWNGGHVRYVLAGQAWASDLPPLVARLGAGPVATVFETDRDTPLMKVELLENGFARVGISKRLTRLVDNPWPGSDPDDAFVLEVEQQVF